MGASYVIDLFHSIHINKKLLVNPGAVTTIHKDELRLVWQNLSSDPTS